MRKNIRLIPVLLLIIAISAAYNFNDRNDKKTPDEVYSLVKINVSSPLDIWILQENDIAVEHYTGNIQSGIEVVVNSAELSRIKNTGISHEVKIADMNSFYAERRRSTESEMAKSYQIMSDDGIDGFSFGSMGGFYTYNEVVQKLDSMRIQFPNLISAKQNIGSSVENRTIWAVKISDNPDVNESSTESAVYFDALHHAREPESMASMMYYMYWLLENYGTNPEVTYLVDNREIFFVPVVNPDGYVYNQTTNPNGGGMWRKNRKNNGSCYGIDLNRNYNYGWGVNSGSSSDPCSETYRGLSAGSEPETQAIKNFTGQIHPKIAFSMHSVAGRYLNPYGYTDTSVAYEIYSEFASDFAARNNYTYGTVIEMLSYYSSGTTRDYLHSHGTYCWTPEVGGSDFWPLQSEIIPVANENLFGMKYLTWVSGAYADLVNYKIGGKGYVLKNDVLDLQFTLKNRGLSQTALNTTLTVIPLYGNISPNSLVSNLGNIASRQYASTSAPMRFYTNQFSNYMDEMKFAVITKQEDIVTSQDTISIYVGKPVALFGDNAETGTSHWTKAGTGIMWDTTFIDPNEGNKNFADSRYGNGKNSCNNTFTLNDTIDLTNTVNPRAEFAAKWATEVTYDYVRFQVSTNFGTSWTSVAGKYTTTVSGQPSYTGIKHWKYEQINLNSYVGRKIKVRFNLVNDNGVPGDGFYFDNFRIVNYKDTITSITQVNGVIPGNFSLEQNYPNPFNPVTKIKFNVASSLKGPTRVELSVYNSLGMLISTLVNSTMEPGSYEAEFDAGNFPSGVYFYRLSAGDFVSTRKMTLLK